MAKLTEQQKQERRLKRAADKKWRRELCVELANDAVQANALEMGIKYQHLSPSFKRLISKFTK
jgi:hypothetical protein